MGAHAYARPHGNIKEEYQNFILEVTTAYILIMETSLCPLSACDDES